MNRTNRFSWSGPAWNDPSLLNNYNENEQEAMDPVNQQMDQSLMNQNDFYYNNQFDSRPNLPDPNLNDDSERHQGGGDRPRSTRKQDRDNRNRSTRDHGRSSHRNNRDRDIIADIIDRLL